MMTKKKLALSKGGFSLALSLTTLAFCVFFFTYGVAVFQRAADKLSEEQAFGGLGPAIALTLCLIGVVGLALPILLFLISCIGNFAGKGSKLVGFTVVSLIAEILAIVLLFFVSLFFLEGTLYDVIAIVATALLGLLTVVSFIHSIVVLAKNKNATDE